ncbi:hypothetical protein ACN9JG_06175 [Cereibacter azotoformans]|uniref:hypothetical protein n=1 Tax=Cereibacter azotoformans TaxID=43057 RepID=UPI003B222C98
MTDDELNALTMPELTALMQAITVAIAAADKAQKAGFNILVSLTADSAGVSVTCGVDVVEPDPASPEAA